MYTLNVKNNYIWPISVNDKTIPERGGSASYKDQGSIILNVMGMGAFNFIDLGDTKLPGYPSVNETWGVLVRTHSTEAYYRYEGGGELSVTLDLYGTATLSTSNGTLIPVTLEELIVDSSGITINN